MERLHRLRDRGLRAHHAYGKWLGTYIANATAVGDTGKTIIGVAVMSVFVVGVNQLFWRPLQAYAERRFSVA